MIPFGFFRSVTRRRYSALDSMRVMLLRGVFQHFLAGQRDEVESAAVHNDVR